MGPRTANCMAWWVAWRFFGALYEMLPIMFVANLASSGHHVCYKSIRTHHSEGAAQALSVYACRRAFQIKLQAICKWVELKVKIQINIYIYIYIYI